jgi:hypothetical protein
MDQKLWVFEVFRRSLGRAGMYWSKPTRVDHMCKKRRVGRRIIFLHMVRLGHWAGNQRSCASNGHIRLPD